MDGRLIIKTDLDTKSVDAQIKYLEHELNNIKSILNDKTIEYDIRLKYESDAEKLQNRIDSLKSSMNDLPEDKGKKIGDNFEKGMKSLKRFALSLFSIRSAYALVSKASSAYLSQDIDLAQKLQSVSVGLGSFLAPAIEYISDMLLKGLGYLNEFIKALTGIDFIAKANAKALDKQAQAQKNLNKQTYGFDEMTIAQDNKSSSSSTSSGLIEIPELDNGLVKKLQDLAIWLKENWNLIKNVGIALGVTFGAVKIAGLLSNIGSLIGSNTLGTGLLGLKLLLVGIATAWTIKLIMDGYNEIKSALDDLHQQLDNNIKQTEANKTATMELCDEYLELANSGKATTEQLRVLDLILNATNGSLVAQFRNLEESKSFWGEFTGANKSATEEQRILSEEMDYTTKFLEKLYNQGRLNEEQTQKYILALDNQIRMMKTLGNNTTDLELKFASLTGTKWTADLKVNIDTKEANSKVDTLGTKLKNLLFNNPFSKAIGNVVSTVRETVGFAHGGIVYQPTRALIGEAGYPEAVVPMTADYLSTLASLIAKYGGNGNSSSGVTNIYLDGRLIQRQIVQRTEEIDFAKNN